jgi:hypothetical protein
MPQLSEWLKVMNAEIARKREDAERAREEEARRESEVVNAPAGQRVAGVAGAKRSAR